MILLDALLNASLMTVTYHAVFCEWALLSSPTIKLLRDIEMSFVCASDVRGYRYPTCGRYRWLFSCCICIIYVWPLCSFLILFDETVTLKVFNKWLHFRYLLDWLHFGRFAIIRTSVPAGQDCMWEMRSAMKQACGTATGGGPERWSW